MKLKPRKIIILGHSGFIGSHLEHLLVQSNRWKVIGHSLPDIDLTVPEQVSKLIPYIDPNSTLVLAAAVKRQFGDTLEAFRRNMSIVENICQLLEKYPVKHLVFLSSSAVYGEETENLSINELTPVNPTSYYGINKYAAERLLKKACANKVLLTCLRPPLIYGPGDMGHTYGPAGFIAAAIEGAPVTLWGDVSELREFIYVIDICRLIEHIIDIEMEGELNVVSGTPYCFADIIDILRIKFPSLEVKNRPRSRQKANHVFDASKVKSKLPDGFNFTALKEGLMQVIECQ